MTNILDEQQVETLRLSISCEVCLELYDGSVADGSKQARVLHCGHTFCFSCLGTVLRAAPAIKPACPSCRARIHANTAGDVPRNYAIEGVAALVKSVRGSLSSVDQDGVAALLTALKPTAAAGDLVGSIEQQVIQATESRTEALRESIPFLAAAAQAEDAQELSESRLRESILRGRSSRPVPPPPINSGVPLSIPAATVESEIIKYVRAQGRPVTLIGVANYLADKRLWPPAQLAVLLQRQQEMRQRSIYGSSRPFVVDAVALQTPSPALLKSFLASRGALETAAAPASNAPALAGAASTASNILHIEVGRNNFSECLCAGGAACGRHLDTITPKPSAAAVAETPGVYHAPALRAAAAVSARSKQRHDEDEEGYYFDNNNYGDDDDDDDGAVYLGRGKGGRRKGGKR